MLPKYRTDPNEKRSLAPATKRGGRYALSHFWAWAEANEYWTPNEVAGHIQDYITQMRRHEQKSPNTIRTNISYVRQWLRQYGIDLDPRRDISLPRRRKRQGKWLSADQVRMLLIKAKGWNFAPAVWLALFAGLRIGEITALTWDRVSLDRGPDGEPMGHIQITGGKSKGGRIIPTCEELQSFLEEWRTTRSMGPFVYHNMGQQITGHPDGLRTIGFPGGWHMLRRTFATTYVRNAPPDEPHTVTMMNLRDLMGHESVSTTEEYVYTDTSNGDMERLRW